MLLQKVDADGLLVVVGEDAAAVALDHARLPHRAVPHDHHLRADAAASVTHTYTVALERAGLARSAVFRVSLG